MKIVGIIPAHLKSVRFPKKIIFKIKGFPMIEHVRRRALLCNNLNKNIFIATCDITIKKIVEFFGGKVIMTSKKHKNGTSRVIEAIKKVNCTHIIILQGDEPLLDPSYIERMIHDMKKSHKNIDAWNTIAKIKKKSELKNNSFVKCTINRNGIIQNLFRNFKKDKIRTEKNIYKIMGLIGFRKDSLNKINNLKPSKKEKKLSIEQLRIIENNMKLKSIIVKVPLPSINEKKDLKQVNKMLNNDNKQKKIFNRIFL